MAAIALRIGLAVAAIFAMGGAVMAHQPYAKVIGDVRADDGELFQIEALYGDGIFGPDPFRIQLVSGGGEVLAVTELQRTGGRAAARCPSVNDCLVTIVRHGTLLPTTYRLDARAIDQPVPAASSREYPEYAQVRQTGFRRIPDLNVLIRLWRGASLTADLLLASVLAALPFGAMVYGSVRVVQWARRWSARLALLAVLPLLVAGYALAAGFFLVVVLGAPATILFLLYLYGTAVAIAAAVMPSPDLEAPA